MMALLPADFVAVVEGGVEETQTLINLPFDYIFFTGSENVGRIVYEAASKNLVPVTLMFEFLQRHLQRQLQNRLQTHLQSLFALLVQHEE
jgi:hypothetical protein